MKDIYLDLIEKFNEFKTAGPETEAEILDTAGDPLFLYALSPDRVNAADSFPWNKSMKVLVLGADYGAFAAVSGRVSELDIADEHPERLKFVEKRFPDLIEAGKLKLLKSVEDRDYDVVIADISGDGLGVYKDLTGYAEKACGFLKTGGSLIIIADNADALRVAAGDEVSDIESRVTADSLRGLSDGLHFGASKLYFPLPNASVARDIYSEDYLPGDGSFREISDGVFEDRNAVFNEAALYGSLCRNGVFEKYAPSFCMVLTGYGLTVTSDDSGKLPDYIRYNRRRAGKYAIKTEVFGTSFVRKTALSEEANAHIESFETKYRLLSGDMEGRKDPVSVLKPRIGVTDAGLKYADFDFLKGRDLGSMLADEIVNGNSPKESIRRALDLVMGPEECVCRSLDSLFENVLVGEDGSCSFIDYEWVSDTPLNRNYVRYRILAYWFAAYKSRLTAYNGVKEFLREFGIDDADIDEFEKKESEFQASVKAEGTDFTEKFRSAAASPLEIREQRQRISELMEWNLRLQDEIEEHKTALSKEREVERLSQNHIRNIEKINSAQKAELETLRAQNADLIRHQGLLHRVKRKFIGKLDAWAPAESRKRRLIRYTKNTVIHPARQCRLYFTEEGRRFISGDFSIGGEFSEGGILRLPSCEAPLVSIVIPAYNQVAYTYACIRSIIANTDAGQTPYEVILADDVSTDATKEIGRYIENLIISRNSSNMGFLKNCNQAAAKAKGRYIFFLNNDTKVHENWLSSLVRLMEADDGIGMAGSKLVYPDGRLQEAGGIIWSDASGWNYGRRDDPGKAEYNYVKDVDYISGAAIMIRTSLWKEIGGFDEYFAPAYCEDSDLAFEVRKHGRRVVYQPQSVVTHFEGISNGTDVQGTGLKRYQLVNQEKFKEKWKEELKKQSVNTGNPDPFTARDRTQGKPCVAVIDHYVPTWDRDAGSKTTYQYLKMFLKKGFNVKFIGDNFLHEEPYTSELCQLGIEVLYGEEYRDNIYEYLRKNSGNIDFCYLNRPHIAIKYLDFLKKNTDIKCIFYGHDLHYLRIMREYELTGEIRKKRESDYWRSVEFSVMMQSDMVYYPSQVEIDAIHRFHPEIKAKAITAYVWDEFNTDILSTPENYRERKGILFVGGFKHPPNADAVKWFAADIMPKIRQAIPDMVFYVAGSGADEEILALNSPEKGIEILGFVSDEKLKELYETTRITVVPLRYGAGVKGKVVEAIYNNSAVVTTSVGSEGIPNAENVMKVVDSDPDTLFENADEIAAEFADSVIKLYSDPEQCAKMSALCSEYMRENYSTDAAWKVVEDDFRKD